MSAWRNPRAFDDPARGIIGFTLIELLVSIAVLALISLVLAQMLGATSQTWLTGQAKVNNFVKARAMLDLLARDLQGGLYRDDLASFPNDQIAFFTERPGFSTSTNSVRNVSWVQYDLGGNTNTILQRGDKALSWTAPGGLTFGSTNAGPSLDAKDIRNTAPGIIGFKILFLYNDGSLSTNYNRLNRPKGFSVGLAVIDDKTLERLELSDPSKIADLRAYFSQNATGTNSVKADWERHLNSDMDWSSYPKSMASGLKVFERYVSLP